MGFALRQGWSSKNSLKVLFEDDLFLAVDKPSGLLVIPTPKREKRTLTFILNEKYRRTKESPKFYPCHRLDRDTSGVILFAKGKRAQKLMMQIFKERDIKKKYIAMVQGSLQKSCGEIKSRIKDLDQRKFNRHSPGRWAVTAYKTIKVKRGYSILEVETMTGRTNQIRIQFSQMGHPLLGDRKYSVVRDYPLKFKRTALHASSVTWKHPISQQRIRINTLLPKDMEVFIARN